jgi:hypothetical protein
MVTQKETKQVHQRVLPAEVSTEAFFYSKQTTKPLVVKMHYAKDGILLTYSNGKKGWLFYGQDIA